MYPDGVIAQGGYSTAIRAHEQFVFPIPDEIESRDAASMMCAGLTVYSPLKTHGCGPGKKVGIMGIGGLGHYAILWAKAMGAEVYALTHDESKFNDIKKMGADHIINTEKKVGSAYYLCCIYAPLLTLFVIMMVGFLARLPTHLGYPPLHARRSRREASAGRLAVNALRARQVRDRGTAEC